MVTINDIRLATMAARKRTGRPGIGTEARAGRIRVVDVTFPTPKGLGVVRPLGEWETAADALTTLSAIK